MVWKLYRNPIHPSVTVDRVVEAVSADAGLGFCQACGQEQEGCEPDAQSYKCESCGERAVHGAEEYLVHLVP